MSRRIFLWQSLKVLDVLSMVACFGFTASILAFPAPGPPLTRFLSLRVSVLNILMFGVLLLVWHWVFTGLGLYRSHRLAPLRRELVDVTFASLLVSAILAAWAAFAHVQFIDYRFVCIFALLSTTVMVVGRWGLRFVARRVRAYGRNVRFLVLAGTNVRARALGELVESQPELGYRLAGFIDDPWPGLDEFEKSGLELVSNLAGFDEYLREHVVDEVIICLPMRSCYRICEEMVRMCRRMGVTVRFHTELFGGDLVRQGGGANEQVLTVYEGEKKGAWTFAKRCTDVLVAALLLTLLSPLLLVVALVIKLASPGPAIFVQERLGLGRRRFRMYKFRSMQVDAEFLLPWLENRNEASGPAFKMENDPRVTWLGRLLRRASIDELPQLFNVLKGDMSLVGPRPLPLRDYEGFTEDWHRRRFSVRPGITCLWQVDGRTRVSFEKWMELDLYYIDNWSYWMDLKILIRTIPAVLRGSGAV